MASRNLARGGSQEHENAQASLQSARERRDVAKDRSELADASGELDTSVALHAAEEQVAAREAWVKWVERDY